MKLIDVHRMLRKISASCYLFIQQMHTENPICDVLIFLNTYYRQSNAHLRK